MAPRPSTVSQQAAHQAAQGTWLTREQIENLASTLDFTDLRDSLPNIAYKAFRSDSTIQL